MLRPIDEEVVTWLMAGDVSIRYQAERDLLHKERPAQRRRIESEGWGKRFLSLRKSNGAWGKGFYQPKWTSTHYTLLDLKNLGIRPENRPIAQTLARIFESQKAQDGGIKPIGREQKSDVCVNGMVLNYSCYFGVNAQALKSVVDFLLSQQMGDGGFNCHSNRKGATHSSLHSTVSVLEGILEYKKNGYRYRLSDLSKARKESEEFILRHRLFRSHRTGKIIDPRFLQLHYPTRWHYDILRALDYFRAAGARYDHRMDDALQVIVDQQTPEGRWKLAAQYPGLMHFEMERAGQPSRWNTLRALRVLRHFKIG
ncbi:MAG TPA: hypothetical protein VG737_03150 [Cyclobacteriaceae bacterium]|nr:hypothetical protein [Cyclobacteriaceae bacterium]